MRRLLTGIVFFCFLLMAAPNGHAQELPKTKKMVNHTWHQVVMVKFKPGAMDQAVQLIDDHFAKAGMKAGTPGPQMMQFKTGEWDMMFVWTMDDITDMNWDVSPQDEKWWAQMAKQEGSIEKAMEVMQEYLNLIESSTSYLATSQEPAQSSQQETAENQNQ